jgi:hypothetical protein
MIESALYDHPAYPPLRVERVTGALERRSATSLRLRFELFAAPGAVVLPPPTGPRRSDRLWEATCFELFLRPADSCGYREFNFSPSGLWAAYDFADYRAGMVQAALPAPPEIRVKESEGRISVDIGLSLDLPQEHYHFGLCAVVEEQDGPRSYWAVSHGASLPDFHHASCFALDLPPPPAP